VKSLRVKETLIQWFEKNPNQKCTRKFIISECMKINPRPSEGSYDRALSSLSEIPKKSKIKRIGKANFIYEPTGSSLHEFLVEDTNITTINIKDSVVIITKEK